MCEHIRIKLWVCLLSVLLGAWVLEPLPAEGGHGAPPSYTGTDADFLQPAGEPHFASLRRFEMLSQGHTQLGGNTRWAAVYRLLGSTHPEEVLAAHGQALTVGGLSLAGNDVSQQIEDLTGNFTVFGHPRPGFYAVGCSSEKGDFGETSECFAIPAVYRRGEPGQFGVLYSFSFGESSSSSVDGFATSPNPPPRATSSRLPLRGADS